MHYREPKEVRIRCRNCGEIVDNIKDIVQEQSSAESKICVKCAPKRKEV